MAPRQLGFNLQSSRSDRDEEAGERCIGLRIVERTVPRGIGQNRQLQLLQLHASVPCTWGHKRHSKAFRTQAQASALALQFT